MLTRPNTDIALLVLRLVFGSSMALAHGWPKAQKLISGDPTSFADPFGTGPVVALVLTVFAELICGLAVAAGIFTRWATIPLIITMLVAILMIHAGDPFPDWEKAALFLAAYLAIFMAGPGRYSLDQRIRP